MVKKVMWLVIVTMVVWSGNLLAAPGDLDTSFGGGDGMVTTDFGSGTDRGYSVAIQGDGKIVVAGKASNGSGDDFAVARYNDDGTLDTTFGGGDGMVTTDFGSGTDRGYSVAIQGDGKIVVAGYASWNGSTGYDFAVAWYNTDGTLDTTFGTGGMVTTDFGCGSYLSRRSVAIQGDGKIVVAGEAPNSSDVDFAVARYEGDPPAGVPSIEIQDGPSPLNMGYVWNYPPEVNPVMQSNPADCKPFAVGNLSSGNLSLQVGLPAFSSGVDVYLAIGFSDALFLIDGSNVLHPASELTVLPPWKTNNFTAIDEALYGNIPTALLPAGVCNLYTLVVPAGETDFSHYYFWATNFVIDH